MAEAFNTDISSLENELIALILDGMISARIDSHAKVSSSLINIKFNKDYYNNYVLKSVCYKLMT